MAAARSGRRRHSVASPYMPGCQPLIEQVLIERLSVSRPAAWRSAYTDYTGSSAHRHQRRGSPRGAVLYLKVVGVLPDIVRSSGVPALLGRSISGCPGLRCSTTSSVPFGLTIKPHQPERSALLPPPLKKTGWNASKSEIAIDAVAARARVLRPGRARRQRGP